MHLADARVDTGGGIIAAGRMTYPSLPDGAFEIKPHDCICLGFRSYFGIKACTATRDPETGFLMPSYQENTVFVPSAIAAVVVNTLASFDPRATHLRMQSQAGSLTRLPREGEKSDQPLSDWTLEITVAEGMVKVHLSAALRMIEEPSSIAQANFWPEETTASRVDISFEVDAVTRTALFGVPLYRQADIRSATYPWQSTHSLPPSAALSLANASIDQQGPLIANSRTGGSICIEDGSYGLSLTPTRAGRLTNGFLGRPTRTDYPRVVLAGGIRLASLFPSDASTTVSIFLEGGFSNRVENEMRGEIPRQIIRETKIRSRFGEMGLMVDCDLKLSLPEPDMRPEWQLSFVVPWTAIVLRYDAVRLPRAAFGVKRQPKH